MVVLLGGFLAGCGGTPATPSSAGTLTGADIPRSLGLAENHSGTTVNLGKALEQAYPGCSGHFAAFTVGGRVPTPDTPGTKIYLELYSESSSCRDTSKATAVFANAAKAVEVKKVEGRPLSGLGDSAVIAQAHSGGADDYALFWRNGSELGFVQLSGPDGNPSISAAQIESLGRRQLARQSEPAAG